MRYMGGKFRIVKPLVKFLESVREDRIYVEPFVGAAWVIANMSGKRIACDAHPDLILMWKALQEGWIPPDSISEDQYTRLRSAPTSALRGFAGFGCSFAGKWFGGYARSGDRNYALNAKNSCLKLVPKLKGVQFEHGDYRDVIYRLSLGLGGCLIYCDPPYESTTGYFQPFSWADFWETVRGWSQFNKVFVSSYQAPSDFEIAAEFPTKTDMRTNLNGKESRTERLFTLKAHPQKKG